MSDDQEKLPDGERRGPLPRTNRPRPARGRGRGAGNAVASEQPIVTVNEAEEPESKEEERASREREMAERPTQLDPSSQAVTRTELTGEPKHNAETRTSVANDRDDPKSSGAVHLGRLIDGRYRVESIIGRGGMGVVYRARHEALDKFAAVKILLPTEDPAVVERFRAEARAATAIGNDHIVDTVDFGQLEDGSTYFVMEFLEGRTLSKLIKAEGHIPLDRTLRIAKQIAEGMGAAHDASIVHRDVKPENIFITRQNKQDDFVKLLDFGIAKVANAQNKLTRAGTIFGTPHYMSPEQAAGTEVDHRTDIYSLGVILYEMVSGRVPFEAENPMGLLTQHMYKQPTPLTELESTPQVIPIGMDAIVLKCMAKKPEDRYPTMGEVARDLERLEQGGAPAAIAELLRRTTADSHPELFRAAKAEAKRAPRPRARWPIAIGALAVLAGGAYAALHFVPGLERLRFWEGAPLPSALPESEAVPKAKARAAKKVHLVALPPDAEIYRDGVRLGKMPITVDVPPDETVWVEVRRQGHFAKQAKLDGTTQVVVVELDQNPHEVLAVPVPEADPKAIQKLDPKAFQKLDAKTLKQLDPQKEETVDEMRRRFAAETAASRAAEHAAEDSVERAEAPKAPDPAPAPPPPQPAGSAP